MPEPQVRSETRVQHLLLLLLFAHTRDLLCFGSHFISARLELSAAAAASRSFVGRYCVGLADAETLRALSLRLSFPLDRFTYNEAFPVESCTQSICDLSLKFGEDGDEDAGGMSRPFGVALLMAGWDTVEGPRLYHTDPSGTYIKCEAKAIGSAAEVAQSTLKEKYKPDMTFKEAEKLAVETLKQVMEEKITSTNVDIASVKPTFRLYPVEEVEEIIKELTS